MFENRCSGDGTSFAEAWCRFRRGQEVAAMAAGAKMVAADVVQWCPVAGEIGGGGCVESGRETRVRVSCVRWRR